MYQVEISIYMLILPTVCYRIDKDYTAILEVKILRDPQSRR